MRFRRMRRLQRAFSLRTKGDEISEDIDSIAMPDAFYFDNQSITFIFPPDALSAEALGEVEVSLPWADLRRRAAADGKP